MADSTDNATHPKFIKSRNSHYSVQIQIEAKSQFEFVPRDTEKSKFLDFIDFGDVKFSVENVLHKSTVWGIVSFTGLFCKRDL